MEEDPKLETKFEMGPEVSEVISLFQKARKADDEKERIKLLEEFKLKLIRLLQSSTENSKPSFAESQELPRVLLTGEKKYFGDDMIFLGGGTSGQRIYFTNHVFLSNDASKADHIGKNAKRSEYRSEKDERLSIELESNDGKPRWMTYFKPEGNDWKFGERYWKKFVEIFGDDTVDLLQEL